MRYITQLIDKRVPLAVVLNANTDDELLINEHQDFLHYSWKPVPGPVSFKILFALLAIENRFFQKQPLLEKQLNHKFTAIETEFTQYPPKKSLTYLFFR